MVKIFFATLKKIHKIFPKNKPTGGPDVPHFIAIAPFEIREKSRFPPPSEPKQGLYLLWGTLYLRLGASRRGAPLRFVCVHDCFFYCWQTSFWAVIQSFPFFLAKRNPILFGFKCALCPSHPCSVHSMG